MSAVIPCPTEPLPNVTAGNKLVVIPILPSTAVAWYVEEDWRHACEKCIELLLTEGTGHTLVIHSRDEHVIRQFALQKPVGRVLVNTPAVLGSMGMTTNLFPAVTLGSEGTWDCTAISSFVPSGTVIPALEANVSGNAVDCRKGR